MGATLTVGGLDWITESQPLRLQDYSDLVQTTPRRASDDTVPRRRGVVAQDEWETDRVDELTIMVFGWTDLAGSPATDAHQQLLANLQQVRRAIRHSHAASLVAQFAVDGGLTYEAADVRVDLSGQGEAGDIWRGRMRIKVPDGYWHKATADTYTSASSASTRTFTVTNDGSLDLYDAIIELSGAATAVTLTNQTFGGASVTFTGSLGTLTTLTCGTKDADRDGSPVHGLVTHAGHDAWLPLAAGDNTIEVAPTGGAVAVDVAVQPAW